MIMKSLCRVTEGVYADFIFGRRSGVMAKGLVFSLSKFVLGMLVLWALDTAGYVFASPAASLVVCLLISIMNVRFLLFLAGGLHLCSADPKGGWAAEKMHYIDKVCLSILTIFSFLYFGFLMLGFATELLVLSGVVSTVEGKVAMDAVALNILDTETALTSSTFLGRSAIMFIYLAKFVIVSLVIPIMIAILGEPRGGNLEQSGK
ncbi:MAG: hypothetical protein QHC90_24015 [Shinella sp.]|nr:hypothetical protein [Shinella sp.]